MAKITTPVKGFTGVVAGVSFANGVGETEDTVALGYFTRRGYTVETDEIVIPDGAPEKSWKVDQLKAYAARESIELGDAKSKDDILAVFAKAAETPPAA